MGCSSSKLDCSARDFIDSNPDIAGIGVISAFVLTMAFTIALSIWSFFKPEYEQYIYHPVDVFIYRRFGRPVKQVSDDYLSNPAKPGSGAVILRNIILGLALQQQVLGIAILSARYASCNITVYHSQIVRILALFSFGTQMTSLQAICLFLIQNRWLRDLSVFLLITMTAMIFHVELLHGRRDVYDHSSTLANCLLTNPPTNMGSDPGKWMVIDIVLLVLALILILDTMFPKQSIITWRNTEDAKVVLNSALSSIDDFENRQASATTPAWATWLRRGPSLLAVYAARAACYILFSFWWILRIYIQIFGGVVPSISFDLFWFGFSLWDLIVTRQNGTYEMNTETAAKENEWSFGQILPMIACGLPILAAIQELLKDRPKEKEHDLDSAATHLLFPMLPGSAAAFNAASSTQRPLSVWSTNTTDESAAQDV